MLLQLVNGNPEVGILVVEPHRNFPAQASGAQMAQMNEVGGQMILIGLRQFVQSAFDFFQTHG